MTPIKELDAAIAALVSVICDYRSLDVFGNGCPCFGATRSTHLLDSFERWTLMKGLGTTGN
jgi:hypothetical protein